MTESAPRAVGPKLTHKSCAPFVTLCVQTLLLLFALESLYTSSIRDGKPAARTASFWIVVVVVGFVPPLGMNSHGPDYVGHVRAMV